MAPASAEGAGTSGLPGGAMLEKARRLVPPHCRRVKVISLGAEGVGKSCLIKRHCEERFVTKHIATIGIDFGVKTADTVSGGPVKVNFWDLSGEARYYEIRNEFYADAQGAIVVYDVNSAATLTALDGCWREALQYGLPPGVPAFLCANKVDLPERKREVSEQAGRAFAERHGFTYVETSANTGKNVDEMFAALFDATYRFSTAQALAPAAQDG